MAVVNLVTPDLQTFPAEVGVGVACTRVPDSLSFCAEVVRTGAALNVEDAASHPVYGENPLVQAGAIGSYAGEPLVHDGRVVGAVSVFDDHARTFTPGQLDVLRAQARLAGAVLDLRSRSAWDELTSLATRPVLLDRVARALARADRNGSLVALLVVDVAAFASVNATHGSTVGDAVLRGLAGRLDDACGPTDSAARTSGDEFAVLLEDLASREEARARAAAMLSAVRGAFDLDSATVEVTLRSGLATGPAVSADVLLAAAERSLSALGVVVTAEPLAVDAARLRRAVADEELVLHYQPVVPLSGRRVEAVEALVRWQHPDHGLLPPAAFIALAEASGVINELGAWVLSAGALQAAAWERAGRDLTVSLNLSPVQLADPGLVDTVRRVLLQTGARPDRLRLELTESALMDQPQAEQALRELQGAGIGLALDDFGTGYSSLSYLRRFPRRHHEDRQVLRGRARAAPRRRRHRRVDRRPGPPHRQGRHRRGRRDPPAGRGAAGPGRARRPGVPVEPGPAGRRARGLARPLVTDRGGAARAHRRAEPSTAARRQRRGADRPHARAGGVAAHHRGRGQRRRLPHRGGLALARAQRGARGGVVRLGGAGQRLRPGCPARPQEGSVR
jgi:diguanylate cyclase (GGDEF)-like protein